MFLNENKLIAMKKEIQEIKKEIHSLKVRNRFLTMLLIFVLLFSLVMNIDTNKDFLRVKGIVVEDDLGNERILIGAPIPFVSGRKDKKEMQVIGHRNRHYQLELAEGKYRKNDYGIMLLDSLGFDRIMIGQQYGKTDQEKQKPPFTGISIYDSLGEKRTEYGISHAIGNEKTHLELNTVNKEEKIALSINEYGVTGLRVQSPDKNIFLGKTDSINPFFKKQKPFNGIIMKTKKNDEKVITMDALVDKDLN